ncbi:zinc-finger homeodomain protein 11-like [Telopea speciosissima]|uniref:zinc-finger homeodomain protein 11-like n=1 Tax=Telopea speciosissima TaxID=54955 RepID=UPI001CC3D60C|nr:zinc-finger homeodomain protein 11-like [Telopea speciosissima]
MRMEEDGPNELYKECMKNHAASLGSYATDGCGEFTPDGDTPGGLQCEACGCHRNFHRKVRVLTGTGRAGNSSNRGGDDLEMELIQYGSGGGGGGGVGGGHPEVVTPVELLELERGVKKRARTKFTAEQKEKMLGFAEKLGWRIQRDQDAEIERFCKMTGVPRQVFKVWMHNHKNSSSSSSASTATTGNASSTLTQ